MLSTSKFGSLNVQNLQGAVVAFTLFNPWRSHVFLPFWNFCWFILPASPIFICQMKINLPSCSKKEASFIILHSPNLIIFPRNCCISLSVHERALSAAGVRPCSVVKSNRYFKSYFLTVIRTINSKCSRLYLFLFLVFCTLISLLPFFPLHTTFFWLPAVTSIIFRTQHKEHVSLYDNSHASQQLLWDLSSDLVIWLRHNVRYALLYPFWSSGTVSFVIFGFSGRE